MTPDYSALDTAALVAAADEALKGVAASAWGRDEEDDAAFIAAAPALVRALVARLDNLNSVQAPARKAA